MRAIAAVVALLLAVLGPAQAEPRAGPKVKVLAFGLWSDQPVFRLEARRAAAIVARRYGGGATMVRANTPGRAAARPEAIAAALEASGRGLDPERDVLFVILTSHGSPQGIADKAGRRVDIVSPPLLKAMLALSPVRHKVVVISACYSGVFIEPLANADTVVITAADAAHPSFGCTNEATWTYFGDAFFNHALRKAGTLGQAFAQATAEVRARELSEGFEPSNPQMAGGAATLATIDAR